MHDSGSTETRHKKPNNRHPMRLPRAKSNESPNNIAVTASSAVVGPRSAPDATAAEIQSAVQVRAVTYFTVRDLGSQLIAMNGWDPEPMERLLADPRFLNIEGQKGTHAELRERMREAIGVLPPHWLEQGAAAGSASAVARRLIEFRGAGADEIVLHGTTPDRLGPLVRAYEQA